MATVSGVTQTESKLCPTPTQSKRHSHHLRSQERGTVLIGVGGCFGGETVFNKPTGVDELTALGTLEEQSLLEPVG